MDKTTQAKWDKWHEAIKPKTIHYWVEIEGEIFGFDMPYSKEPLDLDAALQAALDFHVAGGTIHEAWITGAIMPDGTVVSF